MSNNEINTNKEQPEVAENAAPAKESKNLGYRILAVVIMLFAVGGLFLGMLGAKVEFFQTVLPTFGIPQLSGSLIAFGYDVVHTWISSASAIFSSGISAILANIVQLLLVVVLLIAAVYALIAFIVAMVSGKKAKRCVTPAAMLTLLAYSGIFFWSLFFASSAPLSLSSIDIPCAIVTVVAFISLILIAFGECKSGFVNVLLLLISLAIPFVFAYPRSLTAGALNSDVFDFKGDALFLNIATLFFAVMIAFNLLMSTARVNAKRGALFDCVRFGLQLIASVLVIAATASNEWFGFGNGQVLGTILVIALPVLTLVGFILALVATVFAFKHKKEEAANKPESDADDDDEVGNALIVAPGSAVAANGAPEVQYSEFERKMFALARGERPQPEEVEASAEEEVEEQVDETPEEVEEVYTGEYTYDPFLSTLTLKEKNEFCDMFIANKTGKLEVLPVYVINGDNARFFRKVFVYLGRYRNDISTPLMKKLYAYVNSSGYNLPKNN